MSIFGQVYFLEHPVSGLVKVGFSRYLAQRRRHLETLERSPLTLLATAAGTQDLESALHRLLKATRERGEWFRRSWLLDACLDLCQSPPEGVGPPHYKLRRDVEADHWLIERLKAASQDAGAVYWGEWAALL